MGGTFRWNRKLERFEWCRRLGQRRYGYGNEGVEEDGAVVIGRAEYWHWGGKVRCSRVTGPMGVHRPAMMVRRRVIVRVRVDERGAQRRYLDGQRHRDGNHLPHVPSLFGDCGDGVKGGARD